MKVHINTSNLCTPDVHAVGCADQERKATRRRGFAGSYIADVASLQEIGLDYWSDFIDEWEDGEEQALAYVLAGEPKVYPCVSDHLPERTPAKDRDV